MGKDRKIYNLIDKGEPQSLSDRQNDMLVRREELLLHSLIKQKIILSCIDIKIIVRIGGGNIV